MIKFKDLEIEKSSWIIQKGPSQLRGEGEGGLDETRWTDKPKNFIAYTILCKFCMHNL